MPILGAVIGAAGGIADTIVNAETNRKTRNKTLDLAEKMSNRNVDDLWAQVQDLTAKVEKKTQKISAMKLALGQTELRASAATEAAASSASNEWVLPVGILVVVGWLFIRKK